MTINRTRRHVTCGSTCTRCLSEITRRKKFFLIKNNVVSASTFLFLASSPCTTTTIEQQHAPPNHRSRCQHTTMTRTWCTNTTIVPSFTCSNMVSQVTATISILLQIWFTINAWSPPSSLEITTTSNTTIPTQIKPATKSFGFHSFSTLSKKFITHLRNSGIQLHLSHAAESARSDSDPILRKRRSIARNHSFATNKCPAPGFSRHNLDAAEDRSGWRDMWG